MIYYNNIGNNELVTTTVLVDNPNDDRTCHNLDIEMIEVMSMLSQHVYALVFF